MAKETKDTPAAGGVDVAAIAAAVAAALEPALTALASAVQSASGGGDPMSEPARMVGRPREVGQVSVRLQHISYAPGASGIPGDCIFVDRRIAKGWLNTPGGALPNEPAAAALVTRAGRMGDPALLQWAQAQPQWIEESKEAEPENAATA